MSTLPPHVLHITFHHGELSAPTLTVVCPHDGHPDRRPCASWTERTGPCVCLCPSCQAGDHGDCQSDHIDGIGPKWCVAEPVDECWYASQVDVIGCEALYLCRDLVIEVPVDLIGYGADEPIHVYHCLDATAWPAHAELEELSSDQLLAVAHRMLDALHYHTQPPT